MRHACLSPMRSCLLQAVAALLACSTLKHVDLAALLVIVAAQFGGIYRPRTAVVLLLAINLIFLVVTGLVAEYRGHSGR